MRQTYEIIPPRGMTHDQLFDFVTSAVSHLPYPRPLSPAYAVSFEKYGDAGGKHCYLHMPGHVYTNVINILKKKISDVIVIEVAPEDDPVATTDWRKVTEIGMKGLRAPLNMISPESFAGTVDAHFDHLNEDDALLAQYVVIPRHHQEPEDPKEKEKLSGFTLSAVVRIAAAGPSAKMNLMNLEGSFRAVGVTGSHFHRRIIPGASGRIRRRAGTTDYPVLFNTREFAGFLSWLPQTGTGLPVSDMIPATGIVMAAATFSGSAQRALAMPISALPQHQWWIGPTGSGKSVELHNQAIQFAQQGMGFAVIEPKGDLARDILASIPESRTNDVIYFDPTDEANPIGLNILAGPDPYRTASHVVALFQSKFKDSWGPRLQMYLRVGVYTAAVNGLSILEVKELLRNPAFRRPYVRRLKDASAVRDWEDVETGPDQAVYSVNNKIDIFTANPMTRNIVGQTGAGLNMRDVILGNKILLVPLDTIAMGDTNAEIIGEVIMDQLWMAARSIADDRRRIFPVIVDEFQKFASANEAVEDMLAMARSYKMPFIAAHQYTAQLERANKALLPALKSNARTKGVFALSPEDAGKLAPYFGPLTAEELQHLPQYGVAISMMTASGPAPTVTGITYPPPPPTGHGPAALAASRANHSRPREQVEEEINNRYADLSAERKRPSIGRRES